MQTQIEVPGKGQVSAILDLPNYPKACIIMAHGAGNNMHAELMQHVATRLCRAGYACLRFNFLYREMGRKSPDSEKVLGLTWQAALQFAANDVRLKGLSLIACGKSLGGRIASQEVASGNIKPSALIFLGYPLHAPGRPDRLKDAHLYDVNIPMLFIEGSRDPFCQLDKLNEILPKLQAEMKIIEGGDHSYLIPKSDPRNQSDIYDEVAAASISWLDQLPA